MIRTNRIQVGINVQTVIVIINNNIYYIHKGR